MEAGVLVSTTILYGDLRTGRIAGAIDADGADWAQTLNDPGSIDEVQVPEDVVRRLNLRTTAPAARSFLAVEQDDRMQEAGPLWARAFDWEEGLLTLGASGLWSLFDYRTVIPVLAAGQKVQGVTTTAKGADLGELARYLVALAMTHAGGDLPIVLPDPRPGTAHTETFPGWKLQWLGQQLRELTEREVGAPDIAFRPRRKPSDPRYIEWVMLTGTEASPRLTQGGADWIFDTTVRDSPVLGIGTQEDATGMGSRGWVTGNGSEKDLLIGTDYDPSLIDLGYPLMEQEESRPTVEQQGTLDGYADSLVARSGRPSEVFLVSVHASAAREVQGGDYAQVITKDHAWLGTGSTRMRVQKKAGDLSDKVVLHMYPLQGAL